MNKYIYRITFMAVGLFVFSIISSSACDFCQLSQGITSLGTVGGSGVRINERYTLLGDVYKGTEKIDNTGGAKEEHWTTEVTGFYALNSDFTLLAVLPYKKNVTQGVDPDTGTSANGSSTGLGDIDVFGRYTFYNAHTLDSTTSFAGLLGVKFATGRTDAKMDNGTDFLDSHNQPGTGSTDYIIGVSFSHSISSFSVSGNLLDVIPTKGKFGDTSHQFGNILNYDLTAKYRVYPTVFEPAASQIFLSLGVNGELTEREKVNDVEVPNSGGNTTFLSPGVQVVVAPHWIFELSYQYAIYHNLYGDGQLGETNRVSGGLTYLL